MTLSRGKMNVNGWCPISRNKLSPLQPDLWLIDFNDMYRPLESTSIYKVFEVGENALLFYLIYLESGHDCFNIFIAHFAMHSITQHLKFTLDLHPRANIYISIHVCWLNDSPCITVCYYNLSQLTTQSPRAPTPTVGSSSGSDSSAWR